MEAEEQLRRLHVAASRSPGVPKSALKRSSCIGDSSYMIKSADATATLSSSYELASNGPAAIYGTITKTKKKAVIFPDYVKGGSDDDCDDRRLSNSGHFEFHELNGSPGGRKLHAYSVSGAEQQRRLVDDKNSLPKLLHAQLKNERFENGKQSVHTNNNNHKGGVSSIGRTSDERPSSYYSNNDNDDATSDLQHQQATAAATNGEKIEHYDNFPAERAVVHSSNLTSTLTDDEVRQIELFYHGLRSHVYVCSCLAELYLPASMLPANEQASSSPPIGGNGTTSASWKCGTDELRFVVAGIPVWLVNDRPASHTDPSTISVILAEKGTGFSLWKHAVRSWQLYRRVDQTFYVIHPPPSGDTGLPPFVAGLNFFEITASTLFHDALRTLMMCDNNGSLTRSIARVSKNGLSAADKGRQRSALPKSSISSPCLFAHVTNVDKIRWRKSDQSLMATSKLTAEHGSDQTASKGGKNKAKQHKRSSSHQGETLFRSQVDAKRSNSVDRQRK